MPRKGITLSAALLALALGGGVAWANAPDSEPLPEGARADRVLVDKGGRTLTLLDGGRPLKTYRVALGGAPAGHKREEGDERTPEGVYVLDYRKEDSSAHRSLHVSYPNPMDEARARERGVQPGGFIMVHGITDGLGWVGKLHRLRDWTDRCVAVANWEMDEIMAAVPDGTPIEIHP
jgi:murein L,D-transpeptidase YafK